MSFSSLPFFSRQQEGWCCDLRFKDILSNHLYSCPFVYFVIFLFLRPAEQLKGPLEEYVNKRYPGLVKIVRNQKREGLIRARIEGWKVATGEVTGFFDAHVEFTPSWWVSVESGCDNYWNMLFLEKKQILSHIYSNLNGTPTWLQVTTTAITLVDFMYHFEKPVCEGLYRFTEWEGKG